VSERKRDGGGLPLRVITAIGILVSVLVGGSSLLLSVRPGLRPCLGGSNASFTGAPVFPHVLFRDHQIRMGVPRQDAAKEPNLLGAEVRFSYRASDLRGAELPLTWSLVTVEKDGTLGAVVPGEDRALAMTVKPDACTENGGKDLWVLVPSPRKRYRIVLELYQSTRRDNRLALMETSIFHG
jgi:hypothetical protein